MEGRLLSSTYKKNNTETLNWVDFLFGIEEKRPNETGSCYRTWRLELYIHIFSSIKNRIQIVFIVILFY